MVVLGLSFTNSFIPYMSDDWYDEKVAVILAIPSEVAPSSTHLQYVPPPFGVFFFFYSASEIVSSHDKWASSSLEEEERNKSGKSNARKPLSRPLFSLFFVCFFALISGRRSNTRRRGIGSVTRFGVFWNVVIGVHLTTVGLNNAPFVSLKNQPGLVFVGM